MHDSPLRYLLAVPLAAACALSHAEAFVAAGTRATLTVDYVYESAGRTSENGGYDPYEWKVKRRLSMVADLTAHAPLAMPTVQPMDAAQRASLEGLAGKAQAAQKPMAPMMADVHKVMAKCGEDEACIAREIQKMGFGMAGTPQVEAANKAGRELAALGAPGAPRYQAWRATAQRGTYLIDDHVRISNRDPICLSKPRQRCTREETRKGAGDVPLVDARISAKDRAAAAAGLSAVELDLSGRTLALLPPVPLAMLPYTETITSDEPDGTYDTPIARGARQKQAFFRVSAGKNGYRYDKPLVVALKGGWRDQAGEQVLELQGKRGDAGTLTVRWRFKVS